MVLLDPELEDDAAPEDVVATPVAVLAVAVNGPPPTTAAFPVETLTGRHQQGKSRSGTKNLRHTKFQRKMGRAERLKNVAAWLHAGLTQTEMAERAGVSQPMISLDLILLSKKFHEQAGQSTSEWVARELAYALERRAEHLTAAQDGEDLNTMKHYTLVLKWTERVAMLLGLDAPNKVDNWTDKDWKKFLEENGLEEADAIREAERIINSAKGGPALLEAGSGSQTEGAT
jgi:transcriptional regulator with XRE-family HTH domain